ncbi:protein D2-like isoform X2 [Branchiostoma floridae]|uniref:Protein D2-like isoform X2 n=1 Tax=Branchiostoma floridae TaxID=7739 RepID=A0A9J7MMV5_BRAFL|nr:protein D2-like isoform X2 [Branchiostoma floridae]
MIDDSPICACAKCSGWFRYFSGFLGSSDFSRELLGIPSEIIRKRRELGGGAESLGRGPCSLKVTYEGNTIIVDFGNELTPTQVKSPPQVTWAAEEGYLYTLIMTDPDAPNRSNPKFREWHHWLIVNIPGNDLGRGEVLTDYIGAAPPKESGLHRYVFLVYQQRGKLTCNESRLPNDSTANRGKFKTKVFATKYKLGNPVAGNFFQAQWDDWVPQLYAGMKK